MFVLEKAGTVGDVVLRHHSPEHARNAAIGMPKTMAEKSSYCQLAAAWWLFILGSGMGFACVSPMLSLPFADQRPVYRRRCVGHASVHAIAACRI